MIEIQPGYVEGWSVPLTKSDGAQSLAISAGACDRTDIIQQFGTERRLQLETTCQQQRPHSRILVARLHSRFYLDHAMHHPGEHASTCFASQADLPRAAHGPDSWHFLFHELHRLRLVLVKHRRTSIIELYPSQCRCVDESQAFLSWTKSILRATICETDNINL